MSFLLQQLGQDPGELLQAMLRAAAGAPWQQATVAPANGGARVIQPAKGGARAISQKASMAEASAQRCETRLQEWHADARYQLARWEAEASAGAREIDRARIGVYVLVLAAGESGGLVGGLVGG